MSGAINVSTVRLTGTNYVCNLQAPAAPSATTVNITLPLSNAIGVLYNNGVGTTSWLTNSTATITIGTVVADRLLYVSNNGSLSLQSSDLQISGNEISSPVTIKNSSTNGFAVRRADNAEMISIDTQNSFITLCPDGEVYFGMQSFAGLDRIVATDNTGKLVPVVWRNVNQGNLAGDDAIVKYVGGGGDAQAITVDHLKATVFTCSYLTTNNGDSTFNGNVDVTGVLTVGDGAVGAPSLTFSSMSTSGFYQINGSVYVTSVGQNVMRWTQDTMTCYKTLYPDGAGALDLGASAIHWRNVYATRYYAQDGDVNAPGFAFINNPNTGFFYLNNSISVNINGGWRIRTYANYTSFAQYVRADQNNVRDLGEAAVGWRRLYIGTGTAALPAISFVGASNSGLFYESNATCIGVGGGWRQKWTTTVSTIATDLVPDQNQVRDLGSSAARWDLIYTNRIFGNDGSAAAPTYSFSSSGNTGLFYTGGQTYMSVGGGWRQTWSSTISSFTVHVMPNTHNALSIGNGANWWAHIYSDRHHAGNGSAGNPSLTFANFTTSGLFANTNIVGMTVSGSTRQTWTNSATTIASDVLINGVADCRYFQYDTNKHGYNMGTDGAIFMTCSRLNGVINPNHYGVTVRIVGSTTEARIDFFLGNTPTNVVDWRYVMNYTDFSPGWQGSTGVTLGTGTNKWDNIYAVTATIDNSDRRQKKNIEDSPLGLRFVNQLRPCRFKFITGTSDRFHYGMIAQEVKDVLDMNGIADKDFAGYIYGQEWKKTSTIRRDQNGAEVLDAAGNPVVDTVKEWQDYYGLRYAEFIAPMIKAIQELSARVEALEGRLG